MVIGKGNSLRIGITAHCSLQPKFCKHEPTLNISFMQEYVDIDIVDKITGMLDLRYSPT